MNQIDEKVKELANFRETLEGLKLTYQRSLEEFNQTLVVTTYKLAQQKVEELEAEIRQEAIKIFEETGDKNPHLAVEIKEKINLIVDEYKALNYAKKEMNECLSLNRKIFDKVMKALPEERLPDGVYIEKVPSAYIKQDLSEYLKNNF